MNTFKILVMTILTGFAAACGSGGGSGTSGWQFGTSVAQPSRDSSESITGGSGSWVLGDFFGDSAHVTADNTKSTTEGVASMLPFLTQELGAIKSTNGWNCSQPFQENQMGEIECHALFNAPQGGSIAADRSGTYEKGDDGRYHYQMENDYELHDAAAYDNCGVLTIFNGHIHCAITIDGVQVKGLCETTSNAGGVLNLNRLKSMHQLAIRMNLNCDFDEGLFRYVCAMTGLVNMDGQNYQYETLREFQRKECVTMDGIPQGTPYLMP